jgi:hypothetical protein
VANWTSQVMRIVGFRGALKPFAKASIFLLADVCMVAVSTHTIKTLHRCLSELRVLVLGLKRTSLMRLVNDCVLGGGEPELNGGEQPLVAAQVSGLFEFALFFH